MPYAKGKYALSISDRSGWQFPYLEMVREWNGAIVHTSEFESKQPQLGPFRVKSDPIALRRARPARTAPAVTVLLPLNPFRTTASDTTVTVISPSHGRSTGDVVRFRDCIAANGIPKSDLEDADGYTITKIDTNFYSFVSPTAPTLTGDAGEGSVSAGPVTIIA